MRYTRVHHQICQGSPLDILEFTIRQARVHHQITLFLTLSLCHSISLPPLSITLFLTLSLYSSLSLFLFLLSLLFYHSSPLFLTLSLHISLFLFSITLPPLSLTLLLFLLTLSLYSSSSSLYSSLYPSIPLYSYSLTVFSSHSSPLCFGCPKLFIVQIFLPFMFLKSAVGCFSI